MNLTINIKNIGKLAEAKVHVANFTVFAGPNNTGKSFVSKLLYSLFNAMNANHAQIHMRNLVQPVMNDLSNLSGWISRSVKRPQSTSAEFDSKKLDALFRDRLTTNSEEFSLVKSDLLRLLHELQDQVSEIRLPNSDDTPSSGDRFEKVRNSRVEDSISRLLPSIDELETRLRDEEFQDCINAGMEYKIRQNLIHNFQVPTLRDLRREEGIASQLDVEVVSQFDVEKVGKFEISEDGLEFEVEPYLLRELQRHSNVIYLESPIYWKLKDALDDVRPRAHFMRSGDRETLTGIPGYFYDLVSALRFQRTGDMAFGEVYERLTSDFAMGGRISISKSGEMSFLEDGRSFPLPVAAMGIVNLGMLALLIERKVLDKDAVIFLDEPEAHLHPTWQIIAVETLFELARQGVHVVIATHSVDILKWLEVRAKTSPADKDFIALNQFPAVGTDLDDDFETRLASIKQALTKPFSDLYVKGL